MKFTLMALKLVPEVISKRAAGILMENRFSQVYDTVGRGIFEWEEKGYPIVEE